ncbi:MAG TPA: ATPase, T2SS/T4P/T4SS family, partial [Opitutales bacterium]|nr:ATPase, T2SS/T4P/T4SS family [Opitutales bacterium]
VIMIGEIREAQSAQIAMQAALTGHTVLGSIHTEDALSVWLRLVNLGIAPALVSAGLQGVMAQRLIRRLCPHCARAEAPLPWERSFFGENCPQLLKHPQGC